MNKILETTQLEYGKSSFLIDLVEHTTGLLYIEITQDIVNGKGEKQKIKLNPGVVCVVINVLEIYQKKIPSQIFLGKSYFST